MIPTHYKIRNFKAFGEQVNIPIKPITLIFGPNSSGKSSIFQSLLLIKQSIKKYRCLVTKGEFVNLGPFENILYSKNKQEGLSLQFQFATKDMSVKSFASDFFENIRFNSKISEFERLVDLAKEYNEIEISVDQDRPEGSARSNNFYLGGDPQPLLTTKYHHPDFNNGHSFWKKYWEIFDAKTKHLSDEVVIQALGDCAYLDPGWHTYINELDHDDEEVRWAINEYNKLQTSEGFSRALLSYSYMFGHGLNEDDELVPCNWGSYGNYHRVQELVFEEYYKRTWEARDPFLLLCILGRYVDRFMDKVRYIGPLRATPQQYYYPTRPYSYFDYVGPEGENFPFVLSSDSDEIINLNNELALLGNENKMQLVKLKNSKYNLEDVFALYMLNKKTKIKTNFSNTGFGFSQLLPILLQSQISKNQTLLIEQPELHLHPAIQAEMGDTFIRSAIGKGNNILIETHSEHLILRILRRIRETSEQRQPKNVPAISPEDVAVLYVQPSDTGTQVVEIPVTEDGEFARPWPNGFFAERARELF